MKYIFALFGESGCGKSKIEKEMVTLYSNELNRVIRLSTRPMREGESQKNPYMFTDDEKLRNLVLESVEKIYELEVQKEDWYYATHEDLSFGTGEVFIGSYSVDSLNSLCEYSRFYPDKLKVFPVKIKVGRKERLIRQLNREANPDCTEICRRFLSDEKDYVDYNLDFEYHSISNEGAIGTTLRELKEYVDICMSNVL